MDAIRLGRAMRALRLRLRLHQQDVAERAGVSQQHVSDLERGLAGSMTLDAVTSLAAALDARVVINVSWRGGRLDRLLDEDHAAVVGALAARLRVDGWETVPEATYAIYGERGSIDILAWHAATRTLLVVEVKTEIASAEELLRRHDAKVRLAPAICRERFGMTPAAIGRMLVVADTTTNRRRVARLDNVLAPVYRLRGAALREWLRHPGGSIGGLLFVDARAAGSRTARAGARRRRATPVSGGSVPRTTEGGG